MNRWKLAVPFITACGVSILAMGCARQVEVRATVPGPGPVAVGVEAQPVAPQEVVVELAPPAEQVEVVPVASSANQIWIRGNWHWNGGQWVWRRGHYENHRVGYRWVAPHYEARRGRYVYIDGFWGR